MVWWGAMLPHLKDPPGLAEFINPPTTRQGRIQKMQARFDAWDKALAEGRRRAG